MVLKSEEMVVAYAGGAVIGVEGGAPSRQHHVLIEHDADEPRGQMRAKTAIS